MCGRIVQNFTRKELEHLLLTGDISEIDFDPEPEYQDNLWNEARYNVAPYSNIVIVYSRRSEESSQASTEAGSQKSATCSPKSHEDFHLASGQTLHARHAIWGILNKSTGEMFQHTSNARSETAAGSKLYGRMVRSQRALVIVNGYYEWKTEDKVKRPFYMTKQVKDSKSTNDKSGERDKSSERGKSGGRDKSGDRDKSGGRDKSNRGDRSPPPLMMLAAIYDVDRTGKFSTSVLTMSSGKTQLESVHDRMPVFLNADQGLEWITPAELADPKKTVEGVCHAAAVNSKALKMIEVSQFVNSTKNKGEQCIEPLLSPKDSQKRGIAALFGSAKKSKQE